MKTKLALAVIACGLFTGCQQTGAFSGLAAAGESWRFVNPVVTQSGTTFIIKADLWEHIGTNGFPLPGTNALPTVTVGKP